MGSKGCRQQMLRRTLAAAIALGVGAVLLACDPETEPNNTNATANVNNLKNWSNNAQGASQVYNGKLIKSSDELDIGFLYTQTSSNDLVIKVQSVTTPNAGFTACLWTEVKQCTAQTAVWENCPAANRVDVGSLWSCPIQVCVFGNCSFLPPQVEVATTIGLNKLIRVSHRAMTIGESTFNVPQTINYQFSAFPND